MAPETSIADISRVRTLQHRQQTRDTVKEMSDSIKRAAGPLSGDNSLRPFMIPLGHDPYDIWHLIFSDIEDSKDFEQQTEVRSDNTSADVQLLKDMRPEFLLDHEAAPSIGGAPFWRVASQLNSTLFDLRLVSRQCRNSVEMVLKTAGFRSKKSYLILRSTTQIRAIIGDIVGKEYLIDSFYPPNLEILMTLPNPDEGEVVWEDLLILLKLIGKRVYTFRYNNMDTIQGLYEKLSELVLRMPNLETLELKQDVPFRNSKPLAELPAFPNCPQLKSLIQDWRIMPEPYFQRVLEANPQTKVILMSTLFETEELLVLPQLKLTLQNLECLHIPLYAPLFRHLEFQLPLKEIIFHGIGFRISWTFSPIDIFPFLHQFRDTLERLELGVVVKRTGKHLLNLPNLRFFKWEYNSSFQDLLFLLQAWRLEELQLVLTKDYLDYPNAKAISDCFFKNVTNGFDGFTLWEVFPRCKRVKIEFLFHLKEKSTEICRH